ncbi:hypothetical protein N8I71_15985 [Roseibacterium sp. SDUM158016]|uniref:hypothetical protein n=1 Tax=Roseicyclus sediminis TaxID=2980997 RepID=UPI0021CE688F|nr:hypothetical protein [Roseibacterium sp. SDUM158016]MCU4654341.1 hypothetical protein [Roseibacterium sp. SDUM158016]
MKRTFKMALLLPAICLAATIGVGSTLPEGSEVAIDGAPSDSAAFSMVDLGAFTFPVEQPRHVTYFVTQMSAGFAEEEQAEYHSSAEQVVRLRNAIFDAVFGIRPDAVTGDVDLVVLQDRIERHLSERLPALAMVEIRVLGVQDVPHR